MAALPLLSAACAGLAAAGLGQAGAGLAAVWRFSRASCPILDRPPPVTVLKPLCGDEPLLEEALTSFCVQDYPCMQIVFGLHGHADSALPVVRRLQERFPHLDIHVAIDPTPHGRNRKVGNLLNMLPHAKHDVLVISDSDIHVPPDYLRGVTATLALPETGLVTSLYAGLPADGGVAARLGATQINHAFLPGVLMARALGREACLGATMALRRETLERAGGLRAFRNDVADDALLGQAVNRLGLRVRLAPCVPSTTVPETGISALFPHELRWARTTRSLAPVEYGLSCLQYPLFWALLALLLTPAAWTLALFLGAWALRAGAARALDHRLRLANGAPIPLLPLRDALSVLVIALSFGGDRVRWRGEVLSVGGPDLANGRGLASGKG